MVAKHASSNTIFLSFKTTDTTASVSDVDTENILMKYVGHSGSVNSIAFHPTEHYACTTSGDTTAHVWRCTMNLSSLQRQWSCSNSATEKTVSSFSCYNTYTQKSYHLQCRKCGEERCSSDPVIKCTVCQVLKDLATVFPPPFLTPPFLTPSSLPHFLSIELYFSSTSANQTRFI